MVAHTPPPLPTLFNEPSTLLNDLTALHLGKHCCHQDPPEKSLKIELINCDERCVVVADA